MATPPIPGLMTAEEFLALPVDGRDRALIRGELRVYDDMTYRNPRHARTESRTVYLLSSWADPLPAPRPQILSGEVGFRLPHAPSTIVGIDVVCISAELAQKIAANARVIDGIPILAVEILSPSNKHEDVTEKVQEFLAARIPLIWVADPDFRTVTVYRPDHEPELFNSHQELIGDPHLPGLRIPVAALFAR